MRYYVVTHHEHMEPDRWAFIDRYGWPVYYATLILIIWGGFVCFA